VVDLMVNEEDEMIDSKIIVIEKMVEIMKEEVDLTIVVDLMVNEEDEMIDFKIIVIETMVEIMKEEVDLTIVVVQEEVTIY
jgi:hypothetical protein